MKKIYVVEKVDGYIYECRTQEQASECYRVSTLTINKYKIKIKRGNPKWYKTRSGEEIAFYECLPPHVTIGHFNYAILGDIGTFTCMQDFALGSGKWDAGHKLLALEICQIEDEFKRDKKVKEFIRGIFNENSVKVLEKKQQRTSSGVRFDKDSTTFWRTHD